MLIYNFTRAAINSGKLTVPRRFNRLILFNRDGHHDNEVTTKCIMYPGTNDLSMASTGWESSRSERDDPDRIERAELQGQLQSSIPLIDAGDGPPPAFHPLEPEVKVLSDVTSDNQHDRSQRAHTIRVRTAEMAAAVRRHPIRSCSLSTWTGMLALLVGLSVVVNQVWQDRGSLQTLTGRMDQVQPQVRALSKTVNALQIMYQNMRNYEDARRGHWRRKRDAQMSRRSRLRIPEETTDQPWHWVLSAPINEVLKGEDSWNTKAVKVPTPSPTTESLPVEGHPSEEDNLEPTPEMEREGYKVKVVPVLMPKPHEGLDNGQRGVYEWNSFTILCMVVGATGLILLLITIFLLYQVIRELTRRSRRQYRSSSNWMMASDLNRMR